MQEQSLFIEALERENPAERAAFLDGACAGDPTLRRRIDRLLQQHQRAGSFLESPAPALAATEDESARERPGPTSSWSRSRACPSPSSETTTS